MVWHSAKSLFDKNILSVDECLNLYAEAKAGNTKADVSYLLRAGIVFAISSMDAYFHDLIRIKTPEVWR